MTFERFNPIPTSASSFSSRRQSNSLNRDRESIYPSQHQRLNRPINSNNSNSNMSESNGKKSPPQRSGSHVGRTGERGRFTSTGPPPRSRSSSVQRHRKSSNTIAGSDLHLHPSYDQQQQQRSDRNRNREFYVSREDPDYARISQSSPTLSATTTTGKGAKNGRSHYPSSQRYAASSQPQNIFKNTSTGSNSQYLTYGSHLSTTTPSRGDSSDAGSVHSAPHHTHSHQTPLPKHRSYVVVERREPTSTTTTTTQISKKNQSPPSHKKEAPATTNKSKAGTVSLPRNHRQVAKSVRKIIEEMKKAADASCPKDRRIAIITNVCAEFDHLDDTRHNVELQQGAATALCKVLAILPSPPQNDGLTNNHNNNNSNDQSDEEIRMIGTALELVFRGHTSFVQVAFEKCGDQLLPLLLIHLEHAEMGMKHADVTILNISRVLLYLSRVADLRVTLARHPGMLNFLQTMATSTLNEESRLVRVRILANLVNSSDDNKQLILEHEGLLDSLLRMAHLDTNDQARDYAGIALMDLAGASCNQVPMAKNEKLLGTLVKIVLVEKVASTRESAITALQNLAFTKKNRLRLVVFKEGIVLECLKKALCSDKHEKSRRRAAGALTNLVCDETAETMGNHTGLLASLALVSTKDDSPDVQSRASMALTKLAAIIPVNKALLDALVVASLSASSNSVSAVLRVKARDPENRETMARHDGILDTLADTCVAPIDTKKNPDCIKDKDNAMRAIMHLTNEKKNRRIMCRRAILDALVHGASISDDDVEKHKLLEEVRNSAVRAVERLATEFRNRSTMAHHEGLLVAIAKATEREAKLEASMMRRGGAPKYSGTTDSATTAGQLSSSSSSSHAFLAKPLLMSLLVSMHNDA